MKDLNKKKDTELEKMLMDKRESLRKLRFEKISGAMKNPNEIKNLKKDIARILTEVNSRTTSPTPLRPGYSGLRGARVS